MGEGVRRRRINGASLIALADAIRTRKKRRRHRADSTPSAPPAETRRRSMNPVHCRQCSAEIAPEARQCPECGAPEPANAAWQPGGYEWRTKATWMGAPVVHIAYGCDVAGRPLIARGLVAIGMRASGGIAFGFVATGFLAIGVVSAGFFSCGVVSVALIAACGVNALAPIAFGVVAAGAMGAGLQFIGWKALF